MTAAERFKMFYKGTFYLAPLSDWIHPPNIPFVVIIVIILPLPIS